MSGFTPWQSSTGGVTLQVMNIIIMFLVLLLLFGGGGFLVGGPIIGGGALGLILLVGLMIYVTDGFQLEA